MISNLSARVECETKKCLLNILIRKYGIRKLKTIKCKMKIKKLILDLPDKQFCKYIKKVEPNVLIKKHECFEIILEER